MAGLRIGIDVGGTFTHGVVLRAPGEVLTTTRTPTTHTGEHGVADGVRSVLAGLLSTLDERNIPRADIELVAHSTTQATNALLEGDVAPVARIVIVPPSEMLLAKAALRGALLDIGGGHHLEMQTHFIPWESIGTDTALPEVGSGMPVAVVQPLAGGHENREQAVAEHYRTLGHPVVCASEITQVLGLAARARTAAVNASMLPTMLRTADFTERAVHELLPGVPIQVVRSDGGAMSIDEMRRQPILSLLSGPAAGASAALDLSGLSEVVFIEVGGTSTDITLIKDGRVRHRYATVGGQRLMVPALDLRTMALGGGSMARASRLGLLLGPRSTHIVNLPYIFQSAATEQQIKAIVRLVDPHDKRSKYYVARLDEDRYTAYTLTDLVLHDYLVDEESTGEGKYSELLKGWDSARRERFVNYFDDAFVDWEYNTPFSLAFDMREALDRSCNALCQLIRELADTHGVTLENYQLLAGGGGAPFVGPSVAKCLGMPWQLIEHYSVISAIGAALAVTCASQSRTVAEPTGADIAELTQEVEQRLSAQGAERVATDYEYDPHRQVLTVTGRGSRAYEQDSAAKDDIELESQAVELLSGSVSRAWDSPAALLWVGEKLKRKQLACAQSRLGRCLWLGGIDEWFPAEAGRIADVLETIVNTRTAYTDGGPALPGLALICDGRFIPLDALSSRELIAEVLRWENLPADAPGCFVIRA